MNIIVFIKNKARWNKRPSNIDTMKPTKRTRSAIEEAANKEFQSLSEFLPNLPDTDARTLALRMYYLELSESVSPSDAQASQSEQHVFNQLMYSKEVSGRLGRNSLKDWNSLLAASSIADRVLFVGFIIDSIVRGLETSHVSASLAVGTPRYIVNTY